MEQYYNIHNLVKIHLQTQNQYLLEELDYSLRYFKTDQKPESFDIYIKDLSFFTLPDGAYNVSETFFGFADGIYNKKEEYALTIAQGVMTLFVKENNVTINSLVQYFLLKQQRTFIHGGGVSFKGNGILFPAPPNTGKTTLMSMLREKSGIQFFGDDYVILGADGSMQAYPMDFSIHDYHFNFYKELKKAPEGKQIKRIFYEKFLVDLVRNLPIRRTLKKIARALGYDFLKGGEYLKVPATQLISAEKFGTIAPIKHCFFLNKYEGKELKIEKLDLSVAVTEIVGTLQNEWYKSLPVYHLLASFGLVDFADHVSQVKTIVTKCLENLQIYRIFLPCDMEHQERFRQLNEFLEKEIFNNVEHGK